MRSVLCTIVASGDRREGLDAAGFEVPTGLATVPPEPPSLRFRLERGATDRIGEIRRGKQFELLVESVHREHVVVDIRGKIGGRTRPTVPN